MTPALLLVAALASSPGDEVVARVDATSITVAALSRRIDASRGQAGAPSPSQALDGLVTEAILAAEGRRLRLAGSPDVVARIAAQRRRAAATAFVEQEIAARVEPDEKKLLQSFHAIADFARFEWLVFETRKAADESLQRIRKGSTFSAESNGAVVSKTYAKAADAPPAMRAQLEPPLAEALFRADPGSLIGPVQLANGWALARLFAKEVGTDAEFAARRPSLVDRVRRQGTKEMLAHLSGQLRAKAAVTLDEAFLRKVNVAQPTREELDHAIATVGGEPLRYRDIYATIASLGSGHGTGPAVRIDLAWKEIDARLVQALAVQRGHDKSPSVAAQEPEFERAALASAVVNGIESAVQPPSEDEIQTHYRRNAAAYNRPFEQVLPQVVRDAAAQKRVESVARRIKDLRSKASISINRSALARAERTET